MPYGLKSETIDRLNKVFRKYEQVDEVILYGSRAKGNYAEGSDIDLTMSGDNLDPEIIQKISLEIDDLLLPWMVDLSIFNSIDNNELTEHIKRVGISIYQKNE